MTAIAATSPLLTLTDATPVKGVTGGGDSFAPVLALLLTRDGHDATATTATTGPGTVLPPTGKLLPTSGEPPLVITPADPYPTDPRPTAIASQDATPRVDTAPPDATATLVIAEVGHDPERTAPTEPSPALAAAQPMDSRTRTTRVRLDAPRPARFVPDREAIVGRKGSDVTRDTRETGDSGDVLDPADPSDAALQPETATFRPRTGEELCSPPGADPIDALPASAAPPSPVPASMPSTPAAPAVVDPQIATSAKIAAPPRERTPAARVPLASTPSPHADADPIRQAEPAPGASEAKHAPFMSVAELPAPAPTTDLTATATKPPAVPLRLVTPIASIPGNVVAASPAAPTVVVPTAPAAPSAIVPPTIGALATVATVARTTASPMRPQRAGALATVASEDRTEAAAPLPDAVANAGVTISPARPVVSRDEASSIASDAISIATAPRVPPMPDARPRLAASIAPRPLDPLPQRDVACPADAAVVPAAPSLPGATRLADAPPRSGPARFAVEPTASDALGRGPVTQAPEVARVISPSALAPSIPVVGVAPATITTAETPSPIPTTPVRAILDPVIEQVAARPAAPAPAPTSLDPQRATTPALQQPAPEPFGAALHRAVIAERRPRRDGAVEATATPVAMTPVAPTTTPVDTARADWPAAMITRIEQLRDQLTAPGTPADTRIRLHPDALGQVEVTLRQDATGTHVHVNAAEPAAAKLLADAQPQLQSLAEQRGLRLAQTDIAGGNTQPGQGWTGDRRQPAPALAAPPRRPASPSDAPADESADTRLA